MHTIRDVLVTNRLAPAIACTALCALVAWLGTLNGYYPGWRIRTALTCAALVGLLWFGRRWLSARSVRAILVLALVIGWLGMVSGSNIARLNAYSAEHYPTLISGQTPGVTTRCLPLGLPPCMTHFDIPPEPIPYIYEIRTECWVPFIACGVSYRIE